MLSLLLCIWLMFAGKAWAQDAPWQRADTIRQAVAKIERSIYRDRTEANPAAAIGQFEKAEAAYLATLQVSLSGLSAGLNASIESSFPRLHQAIKNWSGAFRLTIKALENGDLKTARAWLGIREYARASQDTAASQALDAALSGSMAVERAWQIVEEELLRIYTGEMRRAIGEADKAAGKAHTVQLACFSRKAVGMSRPPPLAAVRQFCSLSPGQCLDCPFRGQSKLAVDGAAVDGPPGSVNGFSRAQKGT